MWFAPSLISLLLVAANPCTGLAAQETGPPGAMEDPSEQEVDQEIQDADLNAELDAEQEIYNQAAGRYWNAVGGYRFEILELRTAQADRSEFPPHPMHEYFPVFVTLADEGNGPSVYWLIENSEFLVPDVEQRKEFLRHYMTQLATDHSSGTYVKRALDTLGPMRRQLGEKFVFDFLHLLQNNSRRRGTVAKAYLSEANLLLSKKGWSDPERQAQARAIHEILVDGYMGTESAKLAGTPLLKATLADMRDAQARWVKVSSDALASGGSVESLSPFPAIEFRATVEAIAGTEQPIAIIWRNRFFPAMEQLQRESSGAAIGYMGEWLDTSAGTSHEVWQAHKFELLHFLYSAYPNERFTFESVVSLRRGVPHVDPTLMIDVARVLIAETTDENTLWESKILLAQALARRPVLEELQQAHELFKEVEASAPLERQRKEGMELGQQLGWTLPGAVHATLNLMDSNQTPISSLAYRGQVLVLFFWSMEVPGTKEEILFVKELEQRYKDSPFSILGLSCEMMDQRGYAKLCRENNITWRNALVQQRANPIALQMGISTFPHLVVIDAKGVIRGRSMTHDQTTSLIDTLCVEMQAASSGGQKLGGSLQGLVRFSGSKVALPPLVISEEQSKDCATDGQPLDTTNRSRLVSESGGLANVVVTIQVEGAVKAGHGEKVLVQQTDCRFEPHILVAPIGARLGIKNDDSMVHGVSARTLHNSSFNMVLPPGLSYSTDLNGVDRFQLSSDSHPWMSSWVVVTDASHYTLSNAAGEFSLPNLPVGKYKASWWHESLGKGETAEFEITAGGTALIEFVVEGEASGTR